MTMTSPHERSDGTVICVALNPALDVACEAGAVHPTRKVRTRGQVVHAGGGGVNVARTLAELGLRATLVVLRGGATGTVLDGALAPLDIDVRAVATAAPVRIAFAVHEGPSGLEYRFVPEGDPVDPGDVGRALETVLASVPDAAGAAAPGATCHAVLSGSLPRGAPPDTWARFAEALHARGIRTVVDTSGPALREALHDGAGHLLVKPSLGELEALAGRRLDEAGLRGAAQALVARGAARHVVVSLGAQGALLVHAGGHVRVPAPRVTVRSACGAGDAFVAGTVAALARGETIDEAFLLGVAAGAAAVMTPGTALARRQDVLDVRAALAGRPEQVPA